MIHKIVAYSLKNRTLILALSGALMIWGTISFKKLPIEAYPDIADTWVQVVSQWPGHAAEEVEQQITVPLEIEMNSVPHHTSLRSTSLFGLSVVTLIFDEQTPAFQARQYVLEKLNGLTMPIGVQPTLGPMTSPVGQLYFYILDSKSRSVGELKELEDWELEKQFRGVPGVADVSSFGGVVKEFQVLIDPLHLTHYSLSASQVVQSLSNNNQNSGGGFINRGDQVFNIRGVGKADTILDLERVIVAQKSGTPIRITNLGKVIEGSRPRLGKVSMAERRSDGTIDDRSDVVEGIILGRVGENDEQVLHGIHDKVNELNSSVLPKDIQIKPYLDRSHLIQLTTETVKENMATGMFLVLLILLFFLGSFRSAMIVAATIPLSLLFASIFLELRHIPANLLSLGALDFGMVVDGAVVMIENIFRHKERRRQEAEEDIFQLVAHAAHEVARPISFAITIIILAYLPIFTLQRVEGRLFSPMAWTVAAALFGSMILVLTLVPVLATYFLKGELKEWHNPIIHWIEVKYRKILTLALNKKGVVFGISFASFALTLYLAFGGPIGSEFLPHLDEGSIWVRGTLPASTAYPLADSTVAKARKLIMNFPEIPITVCQIGRSDDGLEATGFFNTECFLDLKPKAEWRKEYKTKSQLISAINQELNKIPGVIWNFSQPISDNVEEMMSGVKGELVLKIFGDDIFVLSQKATELKNLIAQVPGIQDLGIFEELGQPNINIQINRNAIARYGLNISDIQDVIETAVGGKVASQVTQGEKRFNIVVRYLPQFRSTIEQIKRILITTSEGYKIPLEELAEFKIHEGASMIYREGNRRYIAIKFSIRGRDLGSTIEEAQKLVQTKASLPTGYHLQWTGEFESQRRAEARLAIVVPLTVLAIFFVLYFMFGTLKWALMIMADVVLARVGGVLALFLTGTNFSVSSGVGFLAVFGVSIQTGVLLISYINQLRAQGLPTQEAVIDGACRRLRPIMMTALVATFGLLPAALSHAIGSDSQRPMAIVIVGGLIADLIMAFFLLPSLYMTFASSKDRLN